MKLEDLLGLAVPALFLVMLGIESRRPARTFESFPRWRLLGTLFFVAALVVGATAPLLLPLTWLERHPLFDSSSLGLWGVPVGLLLSTFVMYWFHRAEHRFDWLWRLAHQLHHSAPRVDMLGAYYTHPLEVLTKVLLGAIISMYLLGLTPLAASAVGLLSATLSMWQHWNIGTPQWLGYIVPRPESHVLHHERDVHARNYGDLPVWDMLFGTFANPRHARSTKAGFASHASVRVKDMLLMRDVNKLPISTTSVRSGSRLDASGA
jgi:sterol desaturase/sphingolipid hydroxylase (fatty acid hydroxylase superfamily)